MDGKKVILSIHYSFRFLEEKRKQMISDERDKMKALADLQDAIRRLDSQIAVMVGRDAGSSGGAGRSPRDATDKEVLLCPEEKVGDLYEHIKGSPSRAPPSE